ncbi:MAG TPA: DUF503 domain-containing protein [Verrucomicrobiae bacterium]|nr:DUF503 domain-containing protein [Verrucomicrobiae bacterium]
MVVGILQVELTIPGADSLKAKRMVLRSLKDRIRREFNVSIAEVEDNDQWQSGVLAVAVVSNDRRFANQVLSKVEDFIEESRGLVVDDYQIGFL